MIPPEQSGNKLKLKIPHKLAFLLEPHRFKILHGGRGSSKSWSVAQVLVALAYKKKLRILCTREIQGSIYESVHKLLSDTIVRMKLDGFFTVTKEGIKGKNGSEFFFMGLLRNTDKIRSTEAIDICWVEEGHNVTFRSWELITPTIRKEDLDKDGELVEVNKPGDFSQAEIWVTLNPEFEDDETYKRFITATDVNGVVMDINYMDNPWFPRVLRDEMERDKANNYELYKTKWLGLPTGKGLKVWATYDDEVHVREFAMDFIAEKGNSFVAVDPHSKFYPAAIFYTVLPKNQRMNWPEDFYIHVYDEFPNFDDLNGYYHEHRKKTQYDGTLKDLSAMIYSREGIHHGIKVLNRFCDTRYALGAGSGAIETSGLMSEWAKPENGSMVFTLPPVKMIDIQREVLKNDMSYNKLVEVSEFNEPSFSIAPRCQNLRMSMKNHRLAINGKGETLEKEAEKFKDFSDALRIGRAGLHDFTYRDPSQQNGNYSKYFNNGSSYMS